MQTEGCCGGRKHHRLEGLMPIFAKYQDTPGALIPVLQEAQHLFGYLPQDVLHCIAENLAIPISQIYGVVTFYSQFHLNPRGRHIIRVCQGTACHVRGGKAILEELEACLGVQAGGTTADCRFTLEVVACIGACGLAPVMMINQDTHGRLRPDVVAEILTQYE